MNTNSNKTSSKQAQQQVPLNEVEQTVQKRIASRDRKNIAIISVDSRMNKHQFPGIEIKHYKGFDKAASEAHSILKNNQCSIKEDDHKNIIEGHAIQVRQSGLTVAIIIDTKNPFSKSDLKPGTIFLSKHLTTKKTEPMSHSIVI